MGADLNDTTLQVFCPVRSRVVISQGVVPGISHLIGITDQVALDIVERQDSRTRSGGDVRYPIE